MKSDCLACATFQIKNKAQIGAASIEIRLFFHFVLLSKLAQNLLFQFVFRFTYDFVRRPRGKRLGRRTHGTKIYESMWTHGRL